MRSRFQGMRAKLALCFGSLVASFVMLEIGFRCVGIQPEFHQSRTDQLFVNNPYIEPRPVPYGFVPNSFYRTTYDSNPRGYFGPGNTVDHHFNSVGWRDAEHLIQKPAGTFRILGLGDSYLYGQGVHRDDICLNKLGAALQRAQEDVKIEAINSGISSLNTRQQRDILVHRGIQYSPDLVILHFVLNDVEKENELFLDRPKIEFTEEYVEIYNSPDAFSKLSHVWGWARQRVQRTVRAKTYIGECLESFESDSSKWEQCRGALADINRTCEQHEIPLLVVIFPFFIDLDGDYPFQPIHDVVAEFCQTNAIPCLDLRDAYRDYHGPELWVHPTDQHPNEIAHGIAAEAMFNFLTRHEELFPLKEQP